MPENHRNQIITDLFTGKNFNDFIKKLEPAHLRDDLKQEVAVIICSWADEKIVGLEERGELSFYVVRMVFNMVTNKYHPFYKTYRSEDIEFKEITRGATHLSYGYDDELDVADKPDPTREETTESLAFRDSERECREQMEDFTLAEIENLYWYNRDLVKLYLEVKTYRAMERETGIPYISCYKTIQKSFEILREKAKAPKPLFSKNELNYIQNGKNETGD